MEVEPVQNEPAETIAKIAPKLNRHKKSTPFNRSLVLGKSVKSSWAEKMKLKNERRNIKAIEDAIKAEKIAVIEEKKRRREENQKRREENARKAEIVVPIRNLKKLKKKGSKRIRKV